MKKTVHPTTARSDKDTRTHIRNKLDESFGKTVGDAYTAKTSGVGPLSFGGSLQACQEAVAAEIVKLPHPDPGKTNSRPPRLRVKGGPRAGL